jgi:hypothetical protein
MELRINISHIFYIALQPLVGQGLLIIEASRSHSAGLVWTSDQPDAETSDNTQHSQETDIHAPGGIRTHALDHWDRPLDRSTSDNNQTQLIKYH